MTSELSKTQLTMQLDEAASELTALMSALDESQVNSVPYENSWTAGQLLRHVTKSINGMAKALIMPSKPAERDAGEKIQGLKDTFLDFSKKMQSPEFIVPENGPYEKQTAIKELQQALEQLKENADQADLTELVEGLPLGPITKLEIVHFSLYHTQRHLHQMKKICAALKEGSSA